MNQKLSVYLKNGKNASTSAISNQKTLYVMYCFYLLTSFLGRLILITYPLFALADIRIAKTALETGSFEVEKSFEDSNSIKKVWTTILYFMLKSLFLVSGIIILCGVTIVLVYLGHIFDAMTSLNYNLMMYILGAPAVLTMLVFILIVNLYFGPATYIIQSHHDIGISDVISKTVSMMRKKAKMTLLLIGVFHWFRYIIYVIICWGLMYLINLMFSTLVVYFFGVIFIIYLLLKLPKILLSKKIASVSLFKDLSNEEDYQALVGNQDPDQVKTILKKEDLLVSLFDENEIDNDASNDQANNDSKSEEL